MGFSLVDSLIVLAYLAGMAAVGIAAGGRQASARDYFLGRRDLPWWAVCFAIVATETSTLTFISIPGLAYVANLNFLQVAFGYLLGRIVVSRVFLPAYVSGDLVTAYELLGRRFGPAMRNLASITFMGTRVLADGVRLFATAIPLALLLKGWTIFADVPADRIYVISILVMASITLTYTFTGGVRAVIWTDVIQMFVYLAGALGAGIVILGALPPDALASIPAGKLSVIATGSGAREFFAAPYTLAASLIGGAFLSMASHGTDQIIVQRLLAVGDLEGSRKALIGSGVLVIFQFALFLLLGLLLFAFYGGAAPGDLGLSKADELFPKFILESMPSGLSGIIIAGLLAAAMSTLSGSVNSLAAAAMNDIYKPYFGGGMSAARELFLSRLFSLIWCAVLVGVAVFFVAGTSAALVELALSIASVTYGGLLGVFLLGALPTHTVQRDAIAGFLAGLTVMALVFLFGAVAWTWFTVIGTSTTVSVGLLFRMLRTV